MRGNPCPSGRKLSGIELPSCFVAVTTCLAPQFPPRLHLVRSEFPRIAVFPNSPYPQLPVPASRPGDAAQKAMHASRSRVSRQPDPGRLPMAPFAHAIIATQWTYHDNKSVLARLAPCGTEFSDSRFIYSFQAGNVSALIAHLT